MTDNDVIKALEHYKGFRLAPHEDYKEGDKCILVDDALDLVNRQKAEIEKKDIEIDILIRKKETLNDEVAELRAEIERLTKALEEQYESCLVVMDIYSAKAIKEFAERLKKKADSGFWQEHSYIDVEDIDNLVREMTEGAK